MSAEGGEERPMGKRMLYLNWKRRRLQRNARGRLHRFMPNSLATDGMAFGASLSSANGG
jgi:hypothetical protein